MHFITVCKCITFSKLENGSFDLSHFSFLFFLMSFGCIVLLIVRLFTVNICSEMQCYGKYTKMICHCVVDRKNAIEKLEITKFERRKKWNNFSCCRFRRTGTPCVSSFFVVCKIFQEHVQFIINMQNS